MMGKWTGRVDFSDSPTGFFGFLREVFEKLAREEEVAADWEGTELPDYPTFGHQDDTYEDVVKYFYTAWSGFSTKKAFAWKDKYRYNEAPDRRVRRIMEKENKAIRAEAIRGFNDAVRQLVAFVRRRDPRYTPNTQSDFDRAEAMKKATAAQAARARAANAAKMGEAVAEWTKIRDPDEEEELSEESEEEEEFECVACRKIFKSEKQWEAHEKSKKHQKAIYALKRQMRKDNATLGLDEDVMDSGIITPMDDEDENYVSKDALAEEETDLINEVEDLDLDDESDASKTSAIEDANSTISSQTPVDKSQNGTSESESGQDEDYAPRDKVTDRIISSTNIELPTDPNPAFPEKKLGKAALKRLKKATKDSDASGSTSSAEFQCVNCAAQFPSKTKLFSHLKDNPKHAAPPTAVKAGKGKGKKK
jgi:DnaJ family protein A protein 5